MTVVQRRLVNAYETLVMASRMTLEEVPDAVVTLEGGAQSTIRQEVDVEIAKRTIEVLR